MTFNPSHVEDAKKETKAELLSWIEHFKPNSAQHMTAKVELSRRTDRGELRYWVVFGIIAACLIFATVSLARYWW